MGRDQVTQPEEDGVCGTGRDVPDRPRSGSPERLFTGLTEHGLKTGSPGGGPGPSPRPYRF